MNNCSSKTACISPVFLYFPEFQSVVYNTCCSKIKGIHSKNVFKMLTRIYLFAPNKPCICVIIYYDVSRNVTATPKMSNVVNFSKYQSRDTANFYPGPTYKIFNFFLGESYKMSFLTNLKNEFCRNISFYY
jgi:hypothetical protein